MKHIVMAIIGFIAVSGFFKFFSKKFPEVKSHKTVQLVSGKNHNCLLNSKGKLWCWGSGEFGQLGDNSSTISQIKAKYIKNIPSFKEIALGYNHTCGVSFKGRVWCWGAGEYGQRGDRKFSETGKKPTLVKNLHNISKVTAGAYHTCALNSKKQVYCWGRGSEGQLGTGARPPFVEMPTKLKSKTKFKEIAAGYDSTCGIDLNDNLWCWGSNRYGKSGFGNRPISASIPTKVNLLPKVRKVSVSKNHICALAFNHKGYCFGAGTYGQRGDRVFSSMTNKPTIIKSSSAIKDISTGNSHTCILTQKNRVKCFGNGRYGQLGNQKLEFKTSLPQSVVKLRNISDISLGYNHSCAIDTRSQVSCWGHGKLGQRGDATQDDRVSSPRKLVFETSSHKAYSH